MNFAPETLDSREFTDSQPDIAEQDRIKKSPFYAQTHERDIAARQQADLRATEADHDEIGDVVEQDAVEGRRDETPQNELGGYAVRHVVDTEPTSHDEKKEETPKANEPDVEEPQESSPRFEASDGNQDDDKSSHDADDDALKPDVYVGQTKPPETATGGDGSDGPGDNTPPMRFEEEPEEPEEPRENPEEVSENPSGSEEVIEESPEDAFRQNYESFRPAAEKLDAEIAKLASPKDHQDFTGEYDSEGDMPGILAFKIDDPQDVSGSKRYQLSIVPEDRPDLQAKEDEHYEALMRLAEIQDPKVRNSLEQLVAHDAASGRLITTNNFGTPLEELLTEEKQAITVDSFRRVLTTLEAMANRGVVPNEDSGRSVLLDANTGVLRFTKPRILEDISTDPEKRVLAVSSAFDGVLDHLRKYEEGDAKMTSVSYRMREMGQRTLRDHYLYVKKYLARATEDVPVEQLKAVYARTRPSAPRSEQTRWRSPNEVHVASALHDYAISESSGNVAHRLMLLQQSHDTYKALVYHRGMTPTGDVETVLRTDTNGRNLLLTNDYFLKARLALAAWPVSEARVRGEGWANKAMRAKVHKGYTTVLDEMLPEGGFDIAAINVDYHTSPFGAIGEVVGLAALSRKAVADGRGLALPTSETRRLHGGPDATIPFVHEDQGYELDIDWKIKGGIGPDVVNVGTLCFQAAETMDHKPYPAYQNNLYKITRSLEYAAELLRDEGTGARVLQPDEKGFLDRVQRGIWSTISEEAWSYHGISYLQGSARF